MTRPSCRSQTGTGDGGAMLVVHWMADGSLWAEVARWSALMLPGTPEWPRTHPTFTGACRLCSQFRGWSHRNASGELVSSRGMMVGAVTWIIMWAAACESEWISSLVPPRWSDEDRHDDAHDLHLGRAQRKLLHSAGEVNSVSVAGPCVNVPANAPIVRPFCCTTDPSV